jgi:hypothetical protein
MRSNSGKDESRDNLHDPTLRESRTGPRQSGGRREEAESARRPPDRAQGLAQPIEVRDAVECERQHQLARARRPAKRTLRLAHAFAGTDDAPQDVG